jgi:hypothetical protein
MFPEEWNNLFMNKRKWIEQVKEKEKTYIKFIYL